MGLLAPLAALLGIELEGLTARAKSTAIVYGLIGVFVLIAVVFLLVAGFLALTDMVGAIWAALIMGGAFLVLALALYLGSMIGRSKRQRQLSERRRASETGAFLTTAAITALPVLARSPALLRFGLPAAAIAAFALMRDKGDKD